MTIGSTSESTTANGSGPSKRGFALRFGLLLSTAALSGLALVATAHLGDAAGSGEAPSAALPATSSSALASAPIAHAPTIYVVRERAEDGGPAVSAEPQVFSSLNIVVLTVAAGSDTSALAAFIADANAEHAAMGLPSIQLVDLREG